MYKYKVTLPYRSLVSGVLLAFLFALPGHSYAQLVIDLPSPGTMLGLTPQFAPPLIKGIMIHPDNPLQFNFLIDPGNVDFKDKTRQDKTRQTNTVSSSNIS